MPNAGSGPTITGKALDMIITIYAAFGGAGAGVFVVGLVVVLIDFITEVNEPMAKQRRRSAKKRRELAKKSRTRRPPIEPGNQDS